LHDLGHTYESLLATRDEVDKVYSAKTAHTQNLLMTQSYAYLVDKALKKGTEALDNIIKRENSNELVGKKKLS